MQKVLCNNFQLRFGFESQTWWNIEAEASKQFEAFGWEIYHFEDASRQRVLNVYLAHTQESPCLNFTKNLYLSFRERLLLRELPFIT